MYCPTRCDTRAVRPEGSTGGFHEGFPASMERHKLHLKANFETTISHYRFKG